MAERLDTNSKRLRHAQMEFDAAKAELVEAERRVQEARRRVVAAREELQRWRRPPPELVGADV